MTREDAKKTLQDMWECLFNEMTNHTFEDLKEHGMLDNYSTAFDMAISALSADGEYVKKGDAISKILIEFVAREEKGNVICACAEAKQTCADILDSLPTYSIPDSVENKGEWIPVSERLPEEDGRYLCTYETEFGVCVDFGKFYKGDWFVGRVTAWKPLPEPYKVEKGGE